MHSYKVHFSNEEQVFDFVTKIRKFDFDMDLKAGCRIVDAKSIVSAAAISDASELTLQIHADDCSEVLDCISPYLAA